MRSYTYTVFVMPSWSGRGFRAVCPHVPKVVGRGETKQEAVGRLRVKLDRRLARMIACGERVCDPRCCTRPLH